MSNKVDYQKKYEDLKKQFEVFTYGVSHDLNAPLRHVREFTNILLSGLGSNITDEQREAIHFITEGVKTSEAMVEGLLTYSRLNTLQKSFAPFSSEHLFTYAKTGCQELIKERNATIHLPKKFPEITGDLEQLHNMTSYLLENAIKFCDSKTRPEIHTDITEDKDSYTLSIKDNGIGIDKKYFEKIFIIFKQLDPETPGIGLGLTLAQKIAERHNGKIWLESKIGKGSTFYVSLPRNPRGEL